MGDGCQHLRSADVRSAEHSYSSIGVGQSSRPLDGVVAIVGFVFEGIPLAVGGVAATDVLHDDHISTGRALQAEIELVVFVVRGALQKNGKFSLCFRAVDVGAELYSVAHGYGHVTVENNRVGISGPGERSKNKCDSNEV